MTSLERLASDAVFLGAMAAPLFVCSFLIRVLIRKSLRSSRRVAAWSVALLVSLGFHPLVQSWVLEPYDSQRGLALAAQARDLGLVGMPSAEARQLLGSPSYEATLQSGTVCWGFKQLPGYWLGSHFQVFCDGSTVTGFEANDD